MPVRHQLPRLFRSNSYALTGLFLSPRTDDSSVEPLRTAIRSGLIDWGPIVHQANLHFCTPLLYVRLRQKGLLQEIPRDLQEYLECLHRANLERNECFMDSLRDILHIAAGLNISCLLLKGAATFCDDLYDDPGARMMGDLDILVDPFDAERLWNRLLRQADYETVAPAVDYSIFSQDFHPHHLPRIFKVGTPVVLEIHLRPGRGQAGRGMPADLLWSGKRAMEWQGLPVLIPNPVSRLLHLTFHSLLPMREFILSNISLAAFAEFSILCQRYPDCLRNEEWLRHGEAIGARREFLTFYNLAQRLIDTRTVQQDRLGGLKTLADEYRVLAAGKLKVQRTQSGRLQKLQNVLSRCWVSEFYFRHHLIWTWRNACYEAGFLNFLKRLRYLCLWYLGVIQAKRQRILTKNQ